MKYKPKWMKRKGYLHITPSLNFENNWRSYLNRIKSSDYIATYAFYPLLHRVLAERRYKKPNSKKHSGRKRSHSHKNISSDKYDKSTKNRPLHYATHFDSLIYAYYANELGKLYEQRLKESPKLNQAVLAYRSIPISDKDTRGKSNIHFAKEVFDEVENRVNAIGETAVVAIDLKSFFSSLSHELIYKSWCDLLNKTSLPKDHLNVFKACTNFSYILYNDLRVDGRNLDELKLAKIRKSKGFNSFFTSNKEFRREIKDGRVPIYKNSFRVADENKNKVMVGIPQGLPISALLANIYLLEFDSKIINDLVDKKDIFYRRYSDDLLLLCSNEEVETVKEYLNNLIKEYKIEISLEKTQCFLFKNMPYNKKGDKRLTSIRLREDRSTIDCPLTYLGFEYRGYITLIKSANLAKYYRRLIKLIKSRSGRAIKLSKNNPTMPRAVYVNQLKKLYDLPLKHSKRVEIKQAFRNRYNLVVNDRGEFEFNHYKSAVNKQSNYISYIKRCDRIFKTDSFSNQLRKKRQIIGQAINKHLVNK